MAAQHRARQAEAAESRSKGRDTCAREAAKPHKVPTQAVIQQMEAHGIHKLWVFCEAARLHISMQSYCRGQGAYWNVHKSNFCSAPPQLLWLGRLATGVQHGALTPPLGRGGTMKLDTH
eukprot:CAMPEP_0180419336 /NCGR_PEP_ID=MMETSP1036_2-20121128/2038_1 /TAXON_ID=632150 /ORGANISM="Azadinium spinosum, Strain 3D9" /LENGTH=118 /DNA_ID=CAMNT_0022424477 /DNA_START=60 /DNA_END=414 /DNA_ORIENTATION=-